MSKFQYNVSLASYTSLKVGGPAEQLVVCTTPQEVIAAAQEAYEKKIPLTVLGGGTNVFIADEGIRGIVLLMRIRGIEQEGERLRAFSGTSIAELVAYSVRAGFAGMSWAGGLPGTVGGAVFGNAGTFGHAIGDLLEWVEIIDEHGKHRIIAKEDCAFGYRTSVFKEKHSNWIILSATFKLQPGEQAELRKEMMEAIAFRNAHHPAPSSAGSFFKNPDAPEGFDGPIKDGHGFQKIPAGWLIEQSGLKGLQVGNAKISEMHANFVVNAGDATAKDIRALAEQVKDTVRKKFNVELEEEVRYLS